VKAVVLFGHGSREPQWRRPMDEVAARIAAREPQVPVRCAFLELEAPDLRAAVAELAAAGCTAVTVLPMFLGVGRHAREDLPKLVDEVRRLHPAVNVELRPPLGEDGRLLELAAKLALE
jgi:sirohydrochlorin cobaltochelatase